MSERKDVLVVENEDGIRNGLVTELKDSGFGTEDAPTAAETRSKVLARGRQFDVVILDLALEDPNSHLSGIALGHEITDAYPKEVPPEFIIFSAYNKPENYEAALKLSPAAYIVKNTDKADDIVNHVRSAAIQRALNALRFEIAEKIEQIAEADYDLLEAIKLLYGQVITPEVKACLGSPFIFLLSDAVGTQILSGDADLPEGYASAYEELQKLTFDRFHDDRPFLFTRKHADMLIELGKLDVLAPLEGGSFLPLHTISSGSDRDLRLSMGILPKDGTVKATVDGEPYRLATILHSDLRAPIIKLVKYLTNIDRAVERAKDRTRRETRRETLLEHTAGFCLHVGEAQLEVLNEAVERGEISPEQELFRRLKKLATDLKATGVEFSHLTPRNTARARAANLPEVRVSEIVERARQEIEDQYLADDLTAVESEGDFRLAVEPNDLFIAVLRVLQWMAQRGETMPEDGPKQQIKVMYARGEGQVEIRFVDRSRRLGGRLRESLFEPFALAAPAATRVKAEGEEPPGLYLPLYLAKVLVEKNGGSLQDRTAELVGDEGHCVVMAFPVGEAQTLAGRKA